MRENRPYGSEGGEGDSPSRPLSEDMNAGIEPLCNPQTACPWPVVYPKFT